MIRYCVTKLGTNKSESRINSLTFTGVTEGFSVFLNLESNFHPNKWWKTFLNLSHVEPCWRLRQYTQYTVPDLHSLKETFNLSRREKKTRKSILAVNSTHLSGQHQIETFDFVEVKKSVYNDVRGRRWRQSKVILQKSHKTIKTVSPCFQYVC